MFKCPCEECICVPICRNKSFQGIIDDCSLLLDYRNDYTVINDEYYYISIMEMERILKPSRWSYRQDAQYHNQDKVKRSNIAWRDIC